MFESCKYTTTLLTVLTIHSTAVTWPEYCIKLFLLCSNYINPIVHAVVVKQHSTCCFKRFGEKMKFFFERWNGHHGQVAFCKKDDSRMGADHAFLSAISKPSNSYKIPIERKKKISSIIIIIDKYVTWFHWLSYSARCFIAYILISKSNGKKANKASEISAQIKCGSLLGMKTRNGQMSHMSVYRWVVQFNSG